MTEQFGNLAFTTLTNSITNSTTTFTVGSATNFPTNTPYRIVVDSEIMIVTAGAGTTSWTVTRGAESTTAVAHSAGAQVSHVLTAGGIAALQVDSAQVTNLSGTYSAIPAAGNPGRIYRPTNGNLLYRDNGVTWDAFGPLFSFTPPLADFTTWVNQGSRGVITTTNGYAYLQDSGPSTNADNIVMRAKATTGTPWTLTAAFQPNFPLNSSGVAGIAVRDSTTGKLKTFNINTFTSNGGTMTMEVVNWTDVNTFNGRPYGPFAVLGRGGPIMMKITNTGTNLQFYTSQDFNNWFLLFSEAVSGNFVGTINQVGFCVNAFNVSNSQPYGMAVYHMVLS